ncbi:MAG: hypothetical protein ABJF10_11400 [Chthoniobacter sp.]|uniref:hypothetical protein n=1 Tax=Chthoniobacter sp. TaxID=2510640 RepID=UPI0032A5E8F7
MQRSSFRLSRPLKAVVYLAFGVLLLTGAALMFPELLPDNPRWEKIPALSRKVHGGAAMIALLVLGALTAHVKRGWKAAKNRLSGSLLLALNAFLVATGYGLYYAADEDFRAWLIRWHGWIGLGTLVLLPAHVIAGRIIIRHLHEQKMRQRTRE